MPKNTLSKKTVEKKQTINVPVDGGSGRIGDDVQQNILGLCIGVERHITHGVGLRIDDCAIEPWIVFIGIFVIFVDQTYNQHLRIQTLNNKKKNTESLGLETNTNM
jgi:hypothetical protein